MACNSVTREKINISGEITSVGLTKEGKFTLVALNDTTWTPLPATALVDRNTVAILNRTNYEVYIQYGLGETAYSGMPVFANNGERRYPIRDTITLYGMFESGGSGSVHVEELA